MDSVEGALWLPSKTTNILCSYYLPPRNSGKNSVHVCVCDNWRYHPNQFFVVYIISPFKYILKQLFTSVSVASGGYCSCGYYSRLWIIVVFFQEGTVTNRAIWLVLSAVRIFLSLTKVTVTTGISACRWKCHVQLIFASELAVTVDLFPSYTSIDD